MTPAQPMTPGQPVAYQPDATAPPGAVNQAYARAAEQTASAVVAPPTDLPPGAPPLGLDGCCPVTLVEQKRWAKGDTQWGAIHRGRTYLFASSEAQRRFLANPDAYSPVIEGNDPVLALDNRQLVPGSSDARSVFRKARLPVLLRGDAASFRAEPQTLRGRNRPGDALAECLRVTARRSRRSPGRSLVLRVAVVSSASRWMSAAFGTRSAEAAVAGSPACGAAGPEAGAQRLARRGQIASSCPRRMVPRRYIRTDRCWGPSFL